MKESPNNSGNFREPCVGYKTPPVHSRFKKGKTGNPGGLPRKSPNGLLSLLREKLSQPYEHGSRTCAEKLVEEWINEALSKVSSARKLAAIEGIVEHLEGKPMQRHEVRDMTPEQFRGKGAEELDYFAIHGEWPERAPTAFSASQKSLQEEL